MRDVPKRDGSVVTNLLHHGAGGQRSKMSRAPRGEYSDSAAISQPVARPALGHGRGGQDKVSIPHCWRTTYFAEVPRAPFRSGYRRQGLLENGMGCAKNGSKTFPSLAGCRRSDADGHGCNRNCNCLVDAASQSAGARRSSTNCGKAGTVICQSHYVPKGARGRPVLVGKQLPLTAPGHATAWG
jgi:hypothetical protein